MKNKILILALVLATLTITGCSPKVSYLEASSVAGSFARVPGTFAD